MKAGGPDSPTGFVGPVQDGVVTFPFAIRKVATFVGLLWGDSYPVLPPVIDAATSPPSQSVISLFVLVESASQLHRVRIPLAALFAQDSDQALWRYSARRRFRQTTMELSTQQDALYLAQSFPLGLERVVCRPWVSLVFRLKSPLPPKNAGLYPAVTPFRPRLAVAAPRRTPNGSASR